MTEDRVSCSGCSRGCMIKILQDGENVILEGNKCIGGEQQVRIQRPHLADHTMIKAEEVKKKGFLSRIFSRK